MNTPARPRTTTTDSATQGSPLATWSQQHIDHVRDACLASPAGIAAAAGLRRLLDQAAQGEIDIDHPQLRPVVRHLERHSGHAAARAIRDHRAWQQERV